MKKIMFTLLIALISGASGLSGQNVGFWFTTEGAGIHFNSDAPGYPPPQPHEFFYGSEHHYRHHAPRHHRKEQKKLRKSHKKYLKAQKKYYKARHDYIKARYKANRHHRHHDDD